jgi:CubicO group peptidase (beta-lactamase class C family)
MPNWFSIPFYSVSIYPAGLMRVSGHSLSLFLRMFMNNGSSLIRPESVVQMKTVVSGVIPYEIINTTSNNKPLYTPLEFGIIWNWQTLEIGRRFLGHGGSMPGATNSMLINEKGDLGVIILTNGDIYPANDVSLKVYTTISNNILALFDCFEN